MKTRRDFLTALTAAVGVYAVRPLAARGKNTTPGAMTIQEVIDLIIDTIPGAPQEGSVDTVKSGDPSQPVTGIVTTFLATAKVIQTAHERGANLIITHEPTFYNHLDEVDWLQGDPVYTAKRRLLEAHNMVVWRFHDYWHLHRPDGITTGALKKLGWQAYASPDELNLCLIPPTPLAELALFLKEAFGAARVRVMGDPAMTCRRVGLLLGASGGRRQIQFLVRDDVEVLVCGEVREWERVRTRCGPGRAPERAYRGGPRPERRTGDGRARALAPASRAGRPRHPRPGGRSVSLRVRGGCFS